MGGLEAYALPRLVAVWRVSLELAVGILWFRLCIVAVTYVGVGNGDQQQNHKCCENAATDKHSKSVWVHAVGSGFRSQNQRVQDNSPVVFTSSPSQARRHLDQRLEK